MNFKKIKLYIDTFFCVVFLPLILLLVPVDRWMTKYPLFAISLIVFLYALFFSIKRLRLPQKFIQKKYWQIFFFAVAVIIIISLLANFPYPKDHVPMVPGYNVKMRSQTVWFMSLTVIGYSLSISLIFELMRQFIQKKVIEEKRQAAELSLYKAQINPHFLFNTLNTLYGLVVSKSSKAEEAFVKFINLMKYNYSQIKNEKVPIFLELNYIRNYVELQKLRLNYHTKVDFECSVDNEEAQIPPLLLISFIENAFKYGSSSRQDCKISILISVRNNVLIFICTNDKINVKKLNPKTTCSPSELRIHCLGLILFMRTIILSKLKILKQPTTYISIYH